MGLRDLLIVEDEPSLSRALAALLHSLHWKATLYASAEEAWQYREQWKECRGALFDISLPGQSGWSLYRELRQQSPKLPIILMSGYADWQLHQEGPQTLYLPKPFGLEELQLALCGVGLET